VRDLVGGCVRRVKVEKSMSRDRHVIDKFGIKLRPYLVFLARHFDM
jgi:hypothetical protein